MRNFKKAVELLLNGYVSPRPWVEGVETDMIQEATYGRDGEVDGVEDIEKSFACIRSATMSCIATLPGDIADGQIGVQEQANRKFILLAPEAIREAQVEIARLEARVSQVTAQLRSAEIRALRAGGTN